MRTLHGPHTRGPVGPVAPGPTTVSDRRSWREVKLVALDFARGGPEAAPRVTAVALVPVHHGRVFVGGLRRWIVPAGDGIPRDMMDRLDRAYVVTWSPTVDRELLERACGEGPAGWRRRTLDLRRLAPTVDRTRGDVGEGLSYELPDVARRCRVPVPQPLEVDDGALTIAQLFLVLATRLESAGCRSVGALLGVGGYDR